MPAAIAGRWFDEKFTRKAREKSARPERLWDQAEAEAIKAKCEGKPGIVEEEKKPSTQAPPLLYDLTTLQREANRPLRFPGADDPADRAGTLREAQGAHLSSYRFALPCRRITSARRRQCHGHASTIRILARHAQKALQQAGSAEQAHLQ